MSFLFNTEILIVRKYTTSYEREIQVFSITYIDIYLIKVATVNEFIIKISN